ncbi:MAG: hypothetical protein KAQ68_02580 [Clostridiales bacterium]|nr:hypothetical protein [Clostridiales bacterium]
MKVDVSRGQNDPRKLRFIAMIMARFRSKSIRGELFYHERIGVNGKNHRAIFPDGECGVKDQVSRGFYSNISQKITWNRAIMHRNI